MNRRQFLKSAAAVPMIAMFPKLSFAAGNNEQKLLILVQLSGGNDSLNTFIPYADPAYYEARGALAIAADQVLPLTQQIGLNPVMALLQEAWSQGDMAIAQGLGYPDPNRSHFRSIDIWHTASDADEFITQGWLSALLPSGDDALEAVVMSGSNGALNEAQNHFIMPRNNRNLRRVYNPSGTSPMATVQHVMQQRGQYNQAIASLDQAQDQGNTISTQFANDTFSQQCASLAQMLANGIQPSVVHLSLGSFDTHDNQRGDHDQLLTQLSQGLAALRNELIAQGCWQRCCIATYSEFGRRVAVNGSMGTDHGTAASHLLLSGDVSGGLWGTQPSLTDLDSGDLKYNQDFRDYYRTLSDWMGWGTSDRLQGRQNMGFLPVS